MDTIVPEDDSVAFSNSANLLSVDEANDEFDWLPKQTAATDGSEDIFDKAMAAQEPNHLDARVEGKNGQFLGVSMPVVADTSGVVDTSEVACPPQKLDEKP